METAWRHRAGETDLLLLEVDAYTLAPDLKWGTSHGGDLFPHLNGSLRVTMVATKFELPFGRNGQHLYPPMKDY